MRVCGRFVAQIDGPNCNLDTNSRENAKDMHYSSTWDFRSMQGRGQGGRGGLGIPLVAGFGK